jgi:hypothetical protein
MKEYLILAGLAAIIILALRYLRKSPYGPFVQKMIEFFMNQKNINDDFMAYKQLMILFSTSMKDNIDAEYVKEEAEKAFRLLAKEAGLEFDEKNADKYIEKWMTFAIDHEEYIKKLQGVLATDVKDPKAVTLLARDLIQGLWYIETPDDLVLAKDMLYVINRSIIILQSDDTTVQKRDKIGKMLFRLIQVFRAYKEKKDKESLKDFIGVLEQIKGVLEGG